MTVQPTRDQLEAELDYWMTRAYEAEGKLWKAEKRLAEWMEHWNTTARTGAVDEIAAVLEANSRADQAEARIKHLEDTARVLVKEALNAEAERDSARGYISELETAVQSRNDVIKHRDARIKAVEDVLDRWQVDGYDALLRRIRRALESVPPPSA